MTTPKNIAIALALTTLIALHSVGFAVGNPQAPTTQVLHRSVEVDGLNIFYREAGPQDAPTLLLLHGFPTSSHMFRNLIPALADEYHVVAPDYPGFGNSSSPSADEFEYTFDNLADVVESFTEKIGLESYSIYLMDYGAPVGFRLAVNHPERVQTLIVQNGNAYDEGIDNAFWQPIKAYWNDRTKEQADPLRSLLTLEATKWQYHPWRPQRGGDQSRYLGACATPPGSSRKSGDPIGPVLQLR